MTLLSNNRIKIFILEKIALAIFVLFLLHLDACSTNDKSSLDSQSSLADVSSVLNNINYESDCYYINEEYYDPLASKGIIVVSEPHADVSGQIKLMQFLNSIHATDSQNFFNFYCLEGAEGEFDVKDFKDLFQRDTSKFFASILDGSLSGWEYQLLKNEKLRAYGVENRDIYQDQINTFGEFYNTINRRLVDSYLLIIDKLEKSLNEKLSSLNDSAAKKIIEGSASDMVINSNILKDSFLLKYNYLLEPLLKNSEKHAFQEALEIAFEFGSITNSFKERLYDASFYNLIKNYLPDSTALIEDIQKEISLNKVALKRDTVMVNNTIEVLGNKNLRTGILFIGSFHKKGVTSLLKKNHISYVYFANSSDHFDYELYQNTLAGKMPATMKPSYLNPIIYPESRSEFLTRLENLSSFEIDEKIGLFLRSPEDYIKNLKKWPEMKQINSGSSDELVFDVTLDKNHNAILKIYSDEEKAAIEKSNVDAMNAKALSLGLDRLFPEYYLLQKMEEKTLIWQEKLESLSFKQLLNQENISQNTKEKFLKSYLALTEKADNLYKEMINSGNFTLTDKYKSSRQLYEVILRKIVESKNLSSKLYTEHGNAVAMENYYQELETIFSEMFKEDFNIERGVYIDYNMQNCFLGDKLIDPTDNCIESALKSKALKFKEVANYKINFEKPISDPSNKEIINDLLKEIFKEDLSEENFKELLAHIFIFDFSDAKKILRDRSYIEILEGYNKVSAPDAIKYQCMASIPTFFFKDRSNKNYLLILLMKEYNERFAKGWDNVIRTIENNFNNKLEVNIAPKQIYEFGEEIS